MFKQLAMSSKTHGGSVNAVTYNQHGYNDTVRFAVINVLGLSFEVLFKDMNNWGISRLTINEYDYKYSSLEMVFWVVGGVPEMIMLNLKYKRDIIVELNYNQMVKNMRYAHNGIAKKGRIRWIDGIDYMQALSKVTTI